MGTPVRTAFCHIFFEANGGQFDSRGRPIFRPKETNRSDEDDGFPPRGKCDHPWDCGVCPILTKYVERRIALEGWKAEWWCDKCLKDFTLRKKQAEDKGMKFEFELLLEGFYHEGGGGSLLSGCTQVFEDGTVCNWESPFLQLVLIRPRIQ